MSAATTRRRPVPSEWREENHRLHVHSHVVGSHAIAGMGNVYRARGRCSCGEEFNPARNADGTLTYCDMDRAGVIEEWKDHVEEAYYAQEVGS